MKMTIVQHFSEGISGSYERTDNIEHTAEELANAKYPCEQCDYVATQGNNLKKHIEAKQSVSLSSYTKAKLEKTSETKTLKNL